MKNLFYLALIAMGFAGVMAPSIASAQKDSTKMTQQDSLKKVKIDDDKGQISSSLLTYKKGRFVGGITITRIDWGFARLIDNGSFTLSPTNDFLDYRGSKTSTFSFDILQFGYRFNQNFKIYLAGGFDWTLIRLRKDITMDRNSPTLSYTTETIDFDKNRFSSSYVHLPLNFEFRTNKDRKGKRVYFVVGPEVAFLLGGKVKQISDERGKQKQYDNYHFQPARVGGTFRVGYSGLGLFTKYYFNDMFDTAAQAGLKNMSFGITLGIN
ncbi:outer membrane beta-barrel protein [Pedobacter sp. MW01-1-1]|uniref:outer membrane beta-barrel protein n=1 Tax=Pedobacter sp. MW01-1-1 TaxID=3383027 RepID=UPI003FEF2BC2